MTIRSAFYVASGERESRLLVMSERRTSGRKRRRPARYGADDDDDDDEKVENIESVVSTRGPIRLLTPVVVAFDDDRGGSRVRLRDAETQTDEERTVDDGREWSSIVVERDAMRSLLRESLVRETAHCAALAASERARAEAESENARLVLELVDRDGRRL